MLFIHASDKAAVLENTKPDTAYFEPLVPQHPTSK